MGTSISALSGTITKSAVDTELDKMRGFVNAIAVGDIPAASVTDQEVVKPVVQGFPVDGARATTQQIYGRSNHPDELCYLDVGANYTSYISQAELVPLVGRHRFGINCGAVEHTINVGGLWYNNIVPIAPSIITMNVERPGWINLSANWEYIHECNYRGDVDDGTWTADTSANDANESADPNNSNTGVAYPLASRNEGGTMGENGEYVGYFAMFVQIKDTSASLTASLGPAWLEVPGSRRWCLPQRIQDFKHSTNSGTNNTTTMVNQHTGSTYLESMGGFHTKLLTSSGMGLFNVCLGWVNPWGLGASRPKSGQLWIAAQNLVAELHYNEHD